MMYIYYMLSDSVKTFLDQCKQQGMETEKVLEQLSQAGWNGEQIEQARKYYSPTEEKVLPDIIPAANNKVPGPGKNKKGLKTLIFAIFGLLFLGSAAAVPAYFIATEKINLNNPALTKTISAAVFSIPFIPKTPKYVLTAAVDAHKKLSKNSFDISLAATSNDFMAAIGAGSMDAEVKGYSDLSDSKNPRFSLTVNVTKEFAGEVRKQDKMVYLKINKLPLLITSGLGLDPDKVTAVMQNWIGIDSTPMETEARKNLDKIEKPTSPVDESVLKIYEKMLNEEVLPYVKVTNENLETAPVYRMDFFPTAQIVDRVALKAQEEYYKSQQYKDYKIPEPQPGTPKVSEVFKDIKFSLWIGRNDYFLRKASLTFTTDPVKGGLDSGISSMLPMPVTVKSPVAFSAVLLMTDFGKNIPVEVPPNYITPEELYKQLMENSALFKAINPTEQAAKARNARRKSDVQAMFMAVEMYIADNGGKLPAGITTSPKNISKKGADICAALLPAYIMSLPADPEIESKVNTISSCAGDYDTGYTIMKTAGKQEITISAPGAELGEVITQTI